MARNSIVAEELPSSGNDQFIRINIHAILNDTSIDTLKDKHDTIVHHAIDDSVHSLTLHSDIPQLAVMRMAAEVTRVTSFSCSMTRGFYPSGITVDWYESQRPNGTILMVENKQIYVRNDSNNRESVVDSNGESDNIKNQSIHLTSPSSHYHSFAEFEVFSKELSVLLQADIHSDWQHNILHPNQRQSYLAKANERPCKENIQALVKWIHSESDKTALLIHSLLRTSIAIDEHAAYLEHNGFMPALLRSGYLSLQLSYEDGKPFVMYIEAIMRADQYEPTWNIPFKTVPHEISDGMTGHQSIHISNSSSIHMLENNTIHMACSNTLNHSINGHTLSAKQAIWMSDLQHGHYQLNIQSTNTLSNKSNEFIEFSIDHRLPLHIHPLWHTLRQQKDDYDSEAIDSVPLLHRIINYFDFFWLNETSSNDRFHKTNDSLSKTNDLLHKTNDSLSSDSLSSDHSSSDSLSGDLQEYCMIAIDAASNVLQANCKIPKQEYSDAFSLSLSMHFLVKMVNFEDYPYDANRGIDIQTPLIQSRNSDGTVIDSPFSNNKASVDTSPSSIDHHSNTVVVPVKAITLPLYQPDFSMPYNVMMISFCFVLVFALALRKAILAAVDEAHVLVRLKRSMSCLLEDAGNEMSMAWRRSRSTFLESQPFSKKMD